jgi:hypothetical protein
VLCPTYLVIQCERHASGLWDDHLDGGILGPNNHPRLERIGGLQEIDRQPESTSASLAISEPIGHRPLRKD